MLWECLNDSWLLLTLLSHLCLVMVNFNAPGGFLAPEMAGVFGFWIPDDDTVVVSALVLQVPLGY